MKKKMLAALFITGIGLSLQTEMLQARDTRIGWDARTYQELTSYTVTNDRNAVVKNAHYPRIKRLSNGDLLMIYMDGKFGWNIYARKSYDDGLTWTDAIIVRKSYYDSGRKDNVCYACPDFIELPNGRIMVAYQWRYSTGYNDLENTNKNCGIEIIQSTNFGDSFIGASAKKAHWGRNWEPSFILLPSGELQLFFTDTHTLNCNVGMLRSFDYGDTWIPETTPDFTSCEYISRTQEGEKTFDGMAVGQYLDNNNGIAIALECDGGTKTPWIVWSSNEANWNYPDFVEPMAGPGEDRKWLLHKDFRGFAPYMEKLPSGDILVQSNGRFTGESQDRMWVFIGNDKARDFSYASSPYAAWWGSIAYIGNNEIISSGNAGYKEDGTDYQMLRIMKGRLNYTMEAEIGNISLTSLDDFDKNSDNYWFIGGVSQAQAYVTMKYTEQNLNIGAYVFDEKLNYYSPMNCDALQFMIYYKGDIYRFTTCVDGSVKWEKRNGGGGYDNIDTEGITNTVAVEGSVGDNSDEDKGYSLIAQLPWGFLGGMPSEDDELRIHLIQINNDYNSSIYPAQSESMPGETLNNPETWLPVYLIRNGNSVETISDRTDMVKIYQVEDGSLQIESENDNRIFTTFRLYNLQGVCIRNFPFSNIIPVSDISSGVYIIQLTDSRNQNVMRKIILR